MITETRVNNDMPLINFCFCRKFDIRLIWS